MAEFLDAAALAVAREANMTQRVRLYQRFYKPAPG
jgi:hypothetical protein